MRHARAGTNDSDEPPSAASSASCASCAYTPLNAHEADDALVDLAHPYTAVLDLARGRKADGLSFQPCVAARCQDRYVVEQFAVRGARGAPDGAEALWTLTGVFDGHLGEATVEHVAHHLPVIVQEFFEAAVRADPAFIRDPTNVSALLKRAFASFDHDIANDVLELFPGGMASLDRLSDRHIQSVINDHGNGLQNYKKVQLNMYGTTALLALVDPQQENLWVANLGDCQAVLATRSTSGNWNGELLTQVHNGTNPQEPFKQPPAFTRRILFNLDPGPGDVGALHAAWEQLLRRNLLSSGSSSLPGVPNQFLTYLTALPVEEHAQCYVDAVVPAGAPGHRDERAMFKIEDNLAVRLLKSALGGDDANAVSEMIAVQSDQAWLDDITIVVQML
ncbi:hypothetical protein DFH11DRAFT_1602036 [Phellopilus nigrolimitatus]|nr:hypothetical protein DFH11DRAFT_1602036 [Phellopilus nigrolimitatus]